MKRFWYYAIIIVAIISIIVTFDLVKNEWLYGNVCILFLGFPACYIVITCISTALLSHLFHFPKNNWLYFSAMIFVTCVAIYGSISDIIGHVECPTCIGISMCFMSLSACISLIILKYLHLRSLSA